MTKAMLILLDFSLVIISPGALCLPASVPPLSHALPLCEQACLLIPPEAIPTLPLCKVLALLPALQLGTVPPLGSQGS